MTVAVVSLALACLLLLIETLVFLVHLAHLRRLDRPHVAEPAAWPRVSVIVPARNEAADIAATVSTRVADDYPDLELVVVDDRSDDGTGRLAAEAAAGDPRVMIARVDELPTGWLGKVHAMHRGAFSASGDWLLFSDGDVSVRRGTLRRAVADCLAHRADMLALVPAFGGGFLVGSVWGTFLRGLMVLVDPRAVADPRSAGAMGSGGFNLVRREAFQRAGGFEPLRMETADDVGLALIVKRAGGRVELVDGSDWISVPMYRTVGAFLAGIEKNAGSFASVPFAAVALGALLIGGILFAPAAALVLGPTWLRGLGVVAAGAFTVSSIVGLWRNSRRWLPAVFWPLGATLMLYGLVRAAWLAKRNGGVSWRGTFYRLDELDRGRHVSLGRLVWPGRSRD